MIKTKKSSFKFKIQPFRPIGKREIDKRLCLFRVKLLKHLKGPHVSVFDLTYVFKQQGHGAQLL